jgi:hypothetical protein
MAPVSTIVPTPRRLSARSSAVSEMTAWRGWHPTITICVHLIGA